MFFILSKLFDIFLTPPGWLLILLALATPWRRPRRRSAWKRRRRFAIAAVLLFWLLSTELVANALFHHLESKAVTTNRPDEVYDAVVLLGGVGEERVTAETGQLAFNDNVERLIATHRVLADNHARYTILSGAAMDSSLANFSEARLLARQLVLWGISPTRLILEEQARNTHENAVYSKQIAIERGFAKVLVVTSAFHMARSVECFGAVGMPVDTLPVDYRTHKGIGRFPEVIMPRAGSWGDSSAFFRETLGLYIYRFQGYAKPPIKMP